MIGDIVRGAVKAAGGWVGSLIAGEPGRVVGSKLAGSLMEKLPGNDSGFEPINTSVRPVNFGRQLGVIRPGMGKSNVGMAKVVNPESLYAAWDNRLNRYYSSAYKIKRTVTSLKA
tara:strand:- start:209 stop:553 length:345 start_codon:yes stop_codon:yes gene_type:complete